MKHTLEELPFFDKSSLISILVDKLKLKDKTGRTVRKWFDAKEPNKNPTEKELKFVKAEIKAFIVTLIKFYLKTLTVNEKKSFAGKIIHLLDK